MITGYTSVIVKRLSSVSLELICRIGDTTTKTVALAISEPPAVADALSVRLVNVLEGFPGKQVSEIFAE